jgi:hypothetical protein
MTVVHMMPSNRQGITNTLSLGFFIVEVVLVGS